VNAQLPPLKAFPKLTLGTTGMIKRGDTITLLTVGYTLQPRSSSTIYGAFITVMGPIFVTARPASGGFSLLVPQSVNDWTYVASTGCDKVVSDDTMAAGPAIVEATNFFKWFSGAM
jgi:hypothetical protein